MRTQMLCPCRPPALASSCSSSHSGSRPVACLAARRAARGGGTSSRRQRSRVCQTQALRPGCSATHTASRAWPGSERRPGSASPRQRRPPSGEPGRAPVHVPAQDVVHAPGKAALQMQLLGSSRAPRSARVLVGTAPTGWKQAQQVSHAPLAESRVSPWSAAA